jgi:hypothetical protein
MVAIAGKATLIDKGPKYCNIASEWLMFQERTRNSDFNRVEARKFMEKAAVSSAMLHEKLQRSPIKSRDGG